MARFIETFRSSVRFRLFLGMAVMLLPVAALGVGNLVATRSMADALEQVIRTEAAERKPVMDLLVVVLQASMPPNDFLILGDLSERERFRRLARDADERFRDMLASPLYQAGERELLLAAEREWLKAKRAGELILAVRRPVGNAGVGRSMEIYDGLIDRTAGFLTQLYDEVQRAIDQQRERAHLLRRRQSMLMGTVFLGALGIALGAGYLLSRSIVRPLGLLQDGVSRFSEGDHSFRVIMDRKDEFGRLASTLNLMAERLEYDSLTGVYSRQEFERLLRDEAARSSRYGHEFSLLMLDLDHFKQVNDTYGHPAGDIALRAFAVRVHRELRSADSIGRYGGEEFAIIMPETGADAAWSVAERVRTGLASQPLLTISGQELTMTVSVGVATFPKDARTGDDLIAAADHALYAAKQSGRNQVVFYHHLTGPGG